MAVREFGDHVKSCQLRNFTFDYYTHGLVEESGEVFDAVRAFRKAAEHLHGSHVSFSDGLESLRDAALSEIGDVLWYMTSLSLEFGDALTMPEAWPKQPKSPQCPAHLTTPSTEPEILMMVCVSKLSGRVKKSLRGDRSLHEFAPAIQEYRDELLDLCAMVAANHGATLERCAMMNVRKLSSRFVRGSVKGDGENR